MAFPIEDKLVIAVASSALFRLDVADEIYRSKGLSAYRQYQREHEDTILEPGIAFPFIRRFLKFNEIFPDTQPVEVVLLSHNDPDTGNRVLRCIDHYGLDITRSAFLTDGHPVDYIDAYNVSLFLSGNESDVRDAIRRGFAAGYVLESKLNDDENDDAAERVAQLASQGAIVDYIASLNLPEGVEPTEEQLAAAAEEAELAAASARNDYYMATQGEKVEITRTLADGEINVANVANGEVQGATLKNGRILIEVDGVFYNTYWVGSHQEAMVVVGDTYDQDKEIN